MERAGIDIVTDGEMRRESYSNRFATALEGVDSQNPAIIVNSLGRSLAAPRVVAPIERSGPIEVRDLVFLKNNTERAAKITLPGPFTMAQQAKNEFYRDDEEMTMAFAAAVNAEALDLVAAGADVIQLDEPWLRNNPEGARRYGVQAIDRALAGVDAVTVVHLCFGYAHLVSDKPRSYFFLPELAQSRALQISIEAAQPRLDLGVLADLAGKIVQLGVLDLSAPVETAEIVAERLRAALKWLAPERLIAAPDCGMKYLTREVAYGKLRALSAGAALVRAEFA